MPIRLAVPSPASKLHAVAFAAVERLVGATLRYPHDSRELVLRSDDHRVELVMCRATDVPALVTQGVVDAGLTGYDVAVENALATGVVLDMRSLAPARTSFVCLLSPPERFDIGVIYTEYPHITRAWARTSSRYGDIEIVPTRGSTEGVIQVDERAAGVALVTSGRTAQANNLEVRAPILATDLCLVTADRARSIGTGLSLDALPRLSMPRLCDGAA